MPKDLKESSVSFTETKWFFADDKQVGGVDAGGKLKNGNYWRFFGFAGQTAEYDNAPKEASEYFDSIIDNVCYQKPKRMK